MDHNQPDYANDEQYDLQARRLSDILSDLLDQDLLEQFEIVTLHGGEILFHYGDEGDSLYVLKAGVLGVRIHNDDGSDSEIARLVPGAIVGEMALLSGNKRSATVYAVNDVGLIRLDREQVMEFLEQDQSALAEISATAIPRWQRQQIFRALRSLLGDIDALSLDVLREQMEWQYYANGEVIFRQGDPSDGMYFVINGRLRTTLTTPDGAQKDLGEIGPGEPVGEMGVLSDEPRSATVHAVSETNLVKLTPARFKRIVRQYPELLLNITRVILERHRRVMQGVKPEMPDSLTMAILPGNINLAAAPFTAALRKALARYGSAKALTSDDFDEMYGESLASQTDLEDVGNTAIVAWMNELDKSENFIFYVADPFSSPWTRRCINHADRVLILAAFTDDPRPGDAERLLYELEVPVRTDLVFIDSAAVDSQNIGKWMEMRSVDAYHFIEVGNEAQLDHLAEQLLR